MKRICISIAVFLLAVSAVAAVSGDGIQTARVLICAEARDGLLKTENGSVVQQLTFDSWGQTAAGPLLPGRYRVETDQGTAVFTLQTNAAISQVTGDGWTDGEAVYLGRPVTGSLTVLYTGQWRWHLDGQEADKAIPSLIRQGEHRICRFDRLPQGYYVLRGEDGNYPFLLTPEEPDIRLDLTDNS